MTTDKIWHQLPERQAAREENHISPVQEKSGALHLVAESVTLHCCSSWDTLARRSFSAAQARLTPFCFVFSQGKKCISDSVTELTDQSYHA